MAPIIKLSHEAELHLTAWAIATGGYPRGLEFSGLGTIEKNGQIFTVKEVKLLNVGDGGYTEFEFEKSQLQNKPGCKLWFHRHPILGWSGRDERTATQEPMGTSPQLVQWSLAMVLTPNGWIGRVDIHVPQSQTFHCPVEPALASPETLAEAEAYLTPQLMETVRELKAEYDKTHGYEAVTYRRPFDESDFDIEQYADGTIPGDEEVYCPDCNSPCQFEEAEDVFGVMSTAAYICTNCGNIVLIADPHSADLFTLEDAPRRSKKRKFAPWQGSFWKFWENR